MKNLFILVSVFLLASCVTTPEENADSEPNTVYYSDLITCSHKYDIRRNFKFYQINQKEKIINDITIFFFQTLPRQDVINLNQFEVRNYKCLNSKGEKYEI